MPFFKPRHSTFYLSDTYGAWLQRKRRFQKRLSDDLRWLVVWLVLLAGALWLYAAFGHGVPGCADSIGFIQAL